MRVQHKVLVIDVETTGLDPASNACIEIGAVMLDESLLMMQEFSSLIAPWEGAQIVEQAMKVNQISPEQLQTAPSIEQAVKRFHETFRPDETKPVLSGWNVWFDVNFLRNLYERANQTWPFSHRLVDVQSIVSFHSQLAALSQGEIIENFLGEKQEHRALADARHTSRLLRLMAQRFSGAIDQ